MSKTEIASYLVTFVDLLVGSVMKGKLPEQAQTLRNQPSNSRTTSAHLEME